MIAVRMFWAGLSIVVLPKVVVVIIIESSSSLVVESSTVTIVSSSIAIRIVESGTLVVWLNGTFGRVAAVSNSEGIESQFLTAHELLNLLDA